MLSSKTNRGKKLADRGNPSLGQDVIKLLKTQDIGYLQCNLQKTRRTIQRLEHEFVLANGAGVDVLGGPRKVGRGQHIVHVQDIEAQRQYKPHLTHEGKVEQMEQQRNFLHRKDHEHEGTDGEDEIIRQKTRRQTEQEAWAAKDGKKIRKTNKQEQEVQRRKLATLKIREKNLQDAADEVQSQRAKMSNIVGGVTKDGLKWKTRERKS